jgi:hypothetical protein
MPASPEATGGVGYTFEDSVVATYLASVIGGAILGHGSGGVVLSRAA